MLQELFYLCGGSAVHQIIRIAERDTVLVYQYGRRHGAGDRDHADIFAIDCRLIQALFDDLASCCLLYTSMPQIDSSTAAEDADLCQLTASPQRADTGVQRGLRSRAFNHSINALAAGHLMNCCIQIF